MGGKSISINNDNVYIDGKLVKLDGELAEAKTFNIVVEGNVESVDGSFTTVVVNGDAQKVKTMSGDATIMGSVNGDVGTMSGDVRVKGQVKGNVKTMSGDITSR